MAEYTGPDEYPIKQIPDTPWWSENYAAMFSSPDEKAALFYSAGRWHSDPTIWRELVMVSLPDGRVIYHKGYSRASTDTIISGGLAQYEIVEPGKTVRLQFDGPMAESTLTKLVEEGARLESTSRCKIDLRMDGLAAVWDMKGDSDAAKQFAGSMHSEQVGKATGSITYDGKEYSFADGYGWRDHSRGAREVSSYAGHNCLNGVFPDGTAFHVYGIKLQDRDELGMSNAVLIRGDRVIPATIKHTEFARSPSDHGLPHEIVLECELGEMTIEIYEVTSSIPMSIVAPFDTGPGVIHHRWSGLLLDEAVRVRWDGQEGLGWSERGLLPGIVG